MVQHPFYCYKGTNVILFFSLLTWHSSIYPIYNSSLSTPIQVNIRDDPNYKGGLIGFALYVPSLPNYCAYSYSENKWNPNATLYGGSNWIKCLVFASTVYSNAYYLGFEDGCSDINDFNNDGDFNDDVYLIRGLTQTSNTVYKVYEPNELGVPAATYGYPETSLGEYFAYVGDDIDYIYDATSAPGTFYPGK